MISAFKINTMRNSLLLILSLVSGCEAFSAVKGCKGGWLTFTCKYPGTFETDRIDVFGPKGTIIRSDKKDVWENKDAYFLYHDTTNKELKVTINQLQQKDSGIYRCGFDQNSNKKDIKQLKLKVDENCQKPLKTTYRTAKTTISCGNTTKDSRVKFFCKVNGKICEDILPTKSPQRLKWSSFNMSTSKVSSQHAGVYWCGLEAEDGSIRTALRRIELKVEDITNFKRSPTIGQNFTYWCRYPENAPTNKFICKGEDPSQCERVVSTTRIYNNRFTMNDDKDNTNITITVRNITSEDTGTYWCGAESTDDTLSDPFFQRFTMTVVQPTTPPVPVSPAGSGGGPPVLITVIVCVVVLLLCVPVVILIYRRRSKNKRNAAAVQHIKEEYIYEEIQERPQKPDSGQEMNTIYVSANFPTNPSASLLYSTINFQSCPGEPGGEALITRPSSSACEYSTVKVGQSPSSEDPLYSTVKKPQSP
ncbi:polymeric immunoglobulin receptor-like [Anoplopoma fimbria]|uniref:polymeric immunoglobulin receptor-like n=1 Tax=Anoplopoma fimbria TaxID=229290 RepID=UPI0023EBDAF9|nr:polymeric immunoglobulin receptor-like [Anoplopoma fimbria]